MKVQITAMNAVDSKDVAKLAGQLGYPASSEEVVRNLQSIRAADNQEVFVARIDAHGPVVGWVHVYEHLSIATGPRCEIGGVVVDGALRSQGIGTQLMLSAELWAKNRGLAGIRFSSRTSRTEAHRLYERLGFQIQKTSHVFNKQIQN